MSLLIWSSNYLSGRRINDVSLFRPSLFQQTKYARAFFIWLPNNKKGNIVQERKENCIFVNGLFFFSFFTVRHIAPLSLSCFLMLGLDKDACGSMEIANRWQVIDPGPFIYESIYLSSLSKSRLHV